MESSTKLVEINVNWDEKVDFWTRMLICIYLADSKFDEALRVKQTHLWSISVVCFIMSLN